MISLLDVNVLISLLDSNHEHHSIVLDWWNGNEDGWASCPITQNRYLRIVTQEKYKNRISIETTIQKLERATSTSKHKFLPDDISLLQTELFEYQHIQGHKQMADIYLLALSIQHGAQFVTLDTSIATNPVKKAAEDSLYVITHRP